MWFEAKHFDQCAGRLVKMQACLDHFGVVEHHKCAGRQVIGQIDEQIFADGPVCFAGEQLGLVTFGEGIFGNALVGERVVEVFNFELARVDHVAPTIICLFGRVLFSLRCLLWAITKPLC